MQNPSLMQTTVRHCACVYYQDWHRTTHLKPAVEGGILNAVSRTVAPQTVDTSTSNNSTLTSPRNTLSSTTGFVVAIGEDVTVPSQAPPDGPRSNALPFDEEAKLVYGVILSLRNMFKKLSGRWVGIHYPRVLHGLSPILLCQR